MASGPRTPGSVAATDPESAFATGDEAHTRILEPEASASGSAPPGAPQAPARIGRYAILRELGRGGMGVVYAAYDEELDRKVALKLLHAGLHGGSRGPERMRREAQAMARLSHPNVAQVYEVERHEGALYIAMEFVEGPTLRGWLRERERSLGQVLDMFIQAGRGLAAAHAVGLTHRDFKPDNVLVGVDGRVRVLDFGLASIRREERGDPREPEPPASLSSSIDEVLTAAGSLLGTPAYMSPEQHRREPVDPRSDEFSFFVALFEAVHGIRPFRGQSLRLLAAQACTGQIREPPRQSRAPTWLRRVILRGLSPKPEDRWPSMEAAIAEISRDRARARRRWLITGACGAALALSGYAAVAASRDRVEACAGAERKLAGIWDAGRRGQLREAAGALAGEAARESLPKIEAALDDYAGAWAATHREACEATARGEQSARLLDLRMRCLEGRRAELAALVEVVGEADAEALARLVGAAYELPGVDRCADAGALMAAVPPPEEQASRELVEAARERVTRGHALVRAGRFDEALAGGEEALSLARESEHEPAVAEAELLNSRALGELGRYEEARAAGRRGFWAAVSSGHDEMALEACFELTFTEAVRLADLEVGRLWLGTGEALGRRLGAGQRARSRLLKLRSDLAAAAGEHAAAVAALREAIAALDELPPGPEVEIARGSLANALGSNLERSGELAAAQEQFQQAVAIYEASLGGAHPKVAAAHHNLGLVLMSRGQVGEATAEVERAIEIWERGLGPEHPRVAIGHNTLGLLLGTAGRAAEAEASLERALQIRERALGPEHPKVASPLTNLGGMALERGDLELARERFERALTIRERTLGRDHPRLLWTLQGIGQLHRRRGDHEASRQALARALAISEGSHGPEHPRTADLLGELAETELAAGAPAEARAQIERAQAIYEGKGWPSPEEQARVFFRLARALVGEGGPRARARELASAALTLVDQVEHPEPGLREGLQALIASSRAAER